MRRPTNSDSPGKRPLKLEIGSVRRMLLEYIVLRRWTMFCVAAEKEYWRATRLRTRRCKADKGCELGLKILVCMWNMFLPL